MEAVFSARERIVEAHGARAIPFLVAELEFGDSGTVAWSSRKLAALGKSAVPAIPALERLARHKDVSLRKVAKAALSQIDGRPMLECS